MKITIDTDKEIIIVPDSYFSQIDTKNKLLASVGAKERVDYVQFIQDSFDSAMKNPVIRKSDASKK